MSEERHSTHTIWETIVAITLKRQLTDIEKEVVMGQHGRKCFADGHAIPEGESVHFDHIRAYAVGGLSDINNIAPMCPDHNRAKGTLPLFDFRTKLELEAFFRTGDRLTLGHLLEHLRSEEVISKRVCEKSCIYIRMEA